METRSLPLNVSHRCTVTAASVIIMICIASAAWWAWYLVSREVTAVYAEGFREVGLPEG
jgi:hypothetical protein